MFDLTGNKIIELEGGERAEHRDKPDDENGDAQRPLPCLPKTPAAGENDDRHRAEIDQVEWLRKAVEYVAREQQDGPALRHRRDREGRQDQREEEEEVERREQHDIGSRSANSRRLTHRHSSRARQSPSQ